MKVKIVWLEGWGEWAVICDDVQHRHSEYLKPRARFWDRRTLEERIEAAACKVRVRHAEVVAREDGIRTAKERLNILANEAKCD